MLPWIIFGVIISLLLILDLGVFHRGPSKVSVRQALFWTGLWITISLLFNLGVYLYKGPEDALNFLTGYLLEKSLSIDNIFVFVAVFKIFKIPSNATHKVLYWGIIGALVMRALFIWLGLALVHHFEWILYVFGVLLIISGIQLGFGKAKERDPTQGWFVRLLMQWIPLTHDTSSHTFFIRTAAGTLATPLFLALISIETADVIFALDSIPAIFAITQDPFIVYTSNIFAILGLRSMYFVLAGAWELFEHLHIGIAAILVLVGVKMLLKDYYSLPTSWMLIAIVLILGACVLSSLKGKQKQS